MNTHRGNHWRALAVVACFAGCDTVADLANGTSHKGGANGPGSVTTSGGKGTGGGAGTASPKGDSGGNLAAGGGTSNSAGGASDAAGGVAAWTTGGTASTGGVASTGAATAGPGGGSPATAGAGGSGSGGAVQATGGSSAAGGSTARGGATGGTNGTAGSAGADCTTCHGDPATNNPAPPKDTFGHGDPASAGVGAHAKHLAASPWHRQGKCTDCHLVPASIPHANGTVDFNWTTPANAGSAKPAFDTTSLTCTGAYCHGTTLAGASAAKTTPIWNQVDETWNACGAACHATPPPPSTGHPTSTACETCHGKVIASFKSGNSPTVAWKDASLHINGTVEVDALTCTSCHGSGSTPAPPKDTKGNTATTAAGVGAHSQHLAGATWHRQGQCGDCHSTPTSNAHSNGSVDFTWGAPSNTSGATPSFSTSNLTCTGVYCHGAKMKDQAASVVHTPAWNKVDGSQDACGKACHATPPASSPHTAASTACQTCHGAVLATFNGASSTWKDASKHINGTVEATLACSSCHGSSAPTLPPGDACHSMVGGGNAPCAACHGAGTSRTQPPAGTHPTGTVVLVSGSAGGIGFNAGNRTCTSSCHGQQRWGNCRDD